MQEMKNENARVTSTAHSGSPAAKSGILRDPSMKSLHRQSLRLLDFVMLRLDPWRRPANWRAA